MSRKYRIVSTPDGSKTKQNLKDGQYSIFMVRSIFLTLQNSEGRSNWDEGAPSLNQDYSIFKEEWINPYGFGVHVTLCQEQHQRKQIERHPLCVYNQERKDPLHSLFPIPAGGRWMSIISADSW